MDSEHEGIGGLQLQPLNLAGAWRSSGAQLVVIDSKLRVVLWSEGMANAMLGFRPAPGTGMDGLPFASVNTRLPAGSPPASPGGLMTLSPSRPPFDLKLFALCSQYHGLDQICNKKMHSKINNFRHRESKSVRIYKGRGAFQTIFFQ